jgi:hypothetical protein
MREDVNQSAAEWSSPVPAETESGLFSAGLGEPKTTNGEKPTAND